MARFRHTTFFQRLGISAPWYYKLQSRGVLPLTPRVGNTNRRALTDEHLADCKRELERYRRARGTLEPVRDKQWADDGTSTDRRQGAARYSDDASMFFRFIGISNKEQFWQLVKRGELPAPPRVEEGRAIDWDDIKYREECQRALEPRYRRVLADLWQRHGPMGIPQRTMDSRWTIRGSQDRVAKAVRIANGIRKRGGGRYRWVCLYDVTDTEIMPTAFTEPWALPRRPLSVDRGPCWVAATTGRPVVVSDVRKDPQHLAAFRSAKSEIVVPVNARDLKRVVGLIDVVSEDPGAFTDDDCGFLEKSARHPTGLWNHHSRRD